VQFGCAVPTIRDRTVQAATKLVFEPIFEADFDPRPYAGLRQAGLAMELLETLQVRTVLKTMPLKSDRHDARGIARFMRFGWFRPVHCKSVAAQEVRAQLSARKLLQTKLHYIENSLRGILRGFGLKLGATTARRFVGWVHELVAGQANLAMIAETLLSVRAVLLGQFTRLERQLHLIARQDRRAQLLQSIPCVGPIVSLTYSSAIDDPGRFRSKKQAGAHVGLTPKKYQSGETDYTGRITKLGDGSVRTALYEAAHLMLIKPVKGCMALKSWAMRIARRAGMQKAKVAIARRLAVIMHRMLADGTSFDPHTTTTAATA
jgi:transposase